MLSQEQVDTKVRIREYRTASLNQQDLDRNFSLATTHIFKWMQAARMDLPWMGPGYRYLGWLEPQMPRRLLVGSQMIRTVRPGILSTAIDNEVRVSCEIGAIGKTSIEFRYQVFFGQSLAATGCTTMIVVGGTPGNLKPTPVPEAIRGLASAEGDEDRKFLLASLDALPKAPSSGAYSLPVVVRYSDEDINKHANHSAMARFFEDAKETILADESADPVLRLLAGMELSAVMISYAAEARALDSCEVKVSSSEGALDMWVLRTSENRWGGKPGLIARGRVLVGGGTLQDSELLRTQSKM